MFDLAIICYLFLGGAGAGACLVASCLTLGVPGDVVERRPDGPYRPLLSSSFGLAALLLALGIVFLVVDLGRFDRLLHLVLYPALTHIAIGSYALLTTFACAVVLALRWGGMIFFRRVWIVRGLCAAGIGSSAVAMLYTGLLLGGLGSVALWSGPWLPALFACSSASCGIALVVLGAVFSGAAGEFTVVLRRLLVCDAAIIAIEVACAAGLALAAFAGVPGKEALALLASVSADPSIVEGGQAAALLAARGMNATEQAGALGAAMLLAGEYAWAFWIVFAGAGIVVPFAVDVALARARESSRAVALRAASVAALCVLAGGFALRFCLVEAGALPSLGMM